MAGVEILTSLGFDLDRAKLQVVERGARRLVTNMSTAASGVTRINAGMAGALGFAKRIFAGYIGLRSIQGITTGFTLAADAQMKFARATGVSLEMIGGLTHGMEINGGTAADVENAIRKISKTALEASQGIKTYSRIYDELGVSITGTDGKLRKQDELLLDVADRFAVMEDGSKKTGLAMQLFGRQGAAMIPLLNEGSKGIKRLTEEARKLGLIVTPEQAEMAERFNDGILRIRGGLRGMRNAVAVRIIPTLTRLIERVNKWWAEGNNADRAMLALKRTAMVLVAVLVRLGAVYAVGKVRLFTSAMLAAAASVRTFGTSMLAAQLKGAALGALVGGLAILILDLYYTLQGKETLITRMIGDPEKVERLKAAVRRFVAGFIQLWETMRPVLFELLKQFGLAAMGLVQAVGPVFKEIGLGVLQLASVIGPAYAVLLKAILKVFAGIFKALKPLFPAFRILLKLGIQPILIPLRIFAFLLGVAARILDLVVKSIMVLATVTQFIWKPALDAVLAVLNVIGAFFGGLASMIDQALVDPVDAVRQAWEDLSDWFTAFWSDFDDAAEDAVLAVIGLFKKIPGAIKAAWGSVISGITKSVNFIVDKIMFAVNALRALTGQQKVKGGLKSGAAAATKRGSAATSDEAQIFGLLATPALAIPGAAGDRGLSRSTSRIAPLAGTMAPVDNRTIQTNNMGGFKVIVQVAEGADAQQIGMTVEQVLDRKIAGILTNASRDLRKPGKGEQ